MESRAARSTITLEKFANLAKRIQSGPSPSADEVTSELDEIIAQATSLLNELQTRPYWSKWKEHASKSESIQDMPANLAQRAPMWYDWLYTDSV